MNIVIVLNLDLIEDLSVVDFGNWIPCYIKSIPVTRDADRSGIHELWDDVKHFFVNWEIAKNIVILYRIFQFIMTTKM